MQHSVPGLLCKFDSSLIQTYVYETNFILLSTSLIIKGKNVVYVITVWMWHKYLSTAIQNYVIMKPYKKL
jgi:hypothetical protein